MAVRARSTSVATSEGPGAPGSVAVSMCPGSSRSPMSPLMGSACSSMMRKNRCVSPGPKLPAARLPGEARGDEVPGRSGLVEGGDGARARRSARALSPKDAFRAVGLPPPAPVECRVRGRALRSARPGGPVGCPWSGLAVPGGGADARGGAAFAGPRLDDGALILKVERAGCALQLRSRRTRNSTVPAPRSKPEVTKSRGAPVSSRAAMAPWCAGQRGRCRRPRAGRSRGRGPRRWAAVVIGRSCRGAARGRSWTQAGAVGRRGRWTCGDLAQLSSFRIER